MTRLPDLERQLIDAAERLEHGPGGARTGSGQPSLRARWKRMSRGGHVAGVLAGGLVLGAVATGSAQVAGLDPFGYLSRFEQYDPDRAPTGRTGQQVELRSPAAADRPWLVRAFVARNGDVCLTGGPAQTASGSGGSGLGCSSSEELADLLSRRQSTSYVDWSPLQGTQDDPRKVLVYTLAPTSVTGVTVQSDGSPGIRATMSDAVLNVPVDHSPAGLSEAGRRALARLPKELTLHLHAAELAAPQGARRTDPLFIPAPAHGLNRSAVAAVTVTTYERWAKTADATADRRRRDHGNVLERIPEPVPGASTLVRRLIPAFGRSRDAGDTMPSRMLSRDMRRRRAQPADSRRLRPVDDRGLGPIWIVPSGQPADAPERFRSDDGFCLVGPAALTAQQTCTTIRSRVPRVEAVICAKGMAPDQTLVWALVPRRMTRATVVLTDGTSTTQPVRDLLLLPRPRTAPRVKQIIWTGPNATELRHDTRYPPQTDSARCAGPNGPEGTIVDLRESLDGSGYLAWFDH